MTTTLLIKCFLSSLLSTTSAIVFFENDVTFTRIIKKTLLPSVVIVGIMAMTDGDLKIIHLTSEAQLIGFSVVAGAFSKPLIEWFHSFIKKGGVESILFMYLERKTGSRRRDITPTGGGEKRDIKGESDDMFDKR